MSDVPTAYRAHPLLDPRLPRRQPAVARLWVATYRNLVRDPAAYRRMVRFYALPAGGSGSERRGLESYSRDADAYLEDLLRLVPEPTAQALRPRRETRDEHELLPLLRAAFESADPRLRYEAQRKLYLAKLLFDIDHCRSVRDGWRHKAQWDALLEEGLWQGARHGVPVEVLAPEGRAWRFHPRVLPPGDREPAVDVVLYRSRFKRESEPASEPGSADGVLSLEESPRWPGLGRRSGSILSKMIRRGIGDPRMVQDLLGAMFIVGSRPQAYALERRLVRTLGGPMRWRDRVDTLAGERDRARLDPRSSSGFQVLKQIVDVLVDDPSGATPYLFAVEVQIYPVEAYLRTLGDAHFASHTAYKKRQFLLDLLPLLFPPSIFGTHRAPETELETASP
jgi:hypothetical protein